MKQEMTGRQWHQLDHVQITCTSLKTGNHTGISSLNFQVIALRWPNRLELTYACPSVRPYVHKKFSDIDLHCVSEKSSHL